jgi:prophage regulatory protein
MPLDICELLQLDPTRRTLGDLIQERSMALAEIVRLRRLAAEGTSRDAGRDAVQVAGGHSSQPAGIEGRLLRLTEVCEMLAMSRSSVYAHMKKGAFPQPVKVGARAVRWRADSVSTWKAGLAP